MDSKAMLLRIAFQYEARQEINTSEWLKRCAKRRSWARIHPEREVENEPEND
jgi:hypothetical protein